MLSPFILRRLKQDVELGMPPIVETRISCPLSLMQTFWYRRLLMKDGAALAHMEKEVEGKVKVCVGGSWVAGELPRQALTSGSVKASNSETNGAAAVVAQYC